MLRSLMKSGPRGGADHRGQGRRMRHAMGADLNGAGDTTALPFTKVSRQTFACGCGSGPAYRAAVVRGTSTGCGSAKSNPMQRISRILGGLRLVVLGAALSGALQAADGDVPVITGATQSQTVNAGGDFTLTVSATGTPPLAYAWWFGALRVPGATNSSLVITNINALASGTYLAVVTNSFGSATSAPIELTVIGPPVILVGPTNQAVYTGQPATFSVTAFSRTTNVTYQWFFQGTSLPEATNQTLSLVNVTTNNAGAYTVQVNNNNGGTTSAPAQLTVLPLPPPALAMGVIRGEERLRVPVLYTAYGIETNLSFSLSWDPAVYSFAAFEPELDPGNTDPDPEPEAAAALRIGPAALPPTTEVALDQGQLAEGRLGVLLSWAPGTVLLPGQALIAQVVFDRNEGVTNRFAGKLAYTNLPVNAVVAPPIEGTNTVVLNGINPQVIHAEPAVLDRQTGYLQQRIHFANPGAVLADNARLLVSGLGVDINSNPLGLANAQGFLLPDFTPYVDFGAIAPTEVREGLLQYYVSDRRTRPTPSFNMLGTPAVIFTPPAGTVLEALVRRTNNLVLVEFPTILARRYYIQYAASLTNFQSGQVETSLPAVLGTGSNLQWLDSGPPRTLPAPADDAGRFYRVLEVQ